MISRRLVPVLVLCSALAVGGCAFLGEGADARDAAEQLAAGLTARDVSDAAFTTDDVQQQFEDLIDPLEGATLEVAVDQVTRSGDESDVRLAWSVGIDGHTWQHTTHATFRKQDDRWRAVWDPAIVASDLEEGGALRVTALKPSRGRILGDGDRPVVVPRPVMRFGVDKVGLSADEADRAARRLARIVGVRPAGYADQVRAAGPRAFVEAIVLRRPQAQDALDAIRGIAGVRGISDRRPLAPTKDFAAAILGTVGPATAEAIEDSNGRLRVGDDAGLSGLQSRYDEQLLGTRGVRVSIVPAAEDQEVTAVFEAPAEAGADLRTTLDLRLQQRAQDLLAGLGPASALVAVRPSDGAILVAASGPGSNGYNTATFGRFAPGSTFKVVSALALLRAGVTPATTVDCPARLTVDGKSFKNYSDYPSDRLGRITMTQAVANSCNTAFIGQRDKVARGALADAAAALGLGVDHDLGFPAYFGQVAPPASQTQAAADLIGQGKVLGSPMAMAAVAASVVKGATVLPRLLTDHEVPPVAAPSQPLTGSEATQLQAMMRAVVTEGSGRALADLPPPDVLAKTGTAEFGSAGATHAWMIGAQGDLAVAVFVAEGASGSRTAGPILEAFLRFAR